MLLHPLDEKPASSLAPETAGVDESRALSPVQRHDLLLEQGRAVLDADGFLLADEVGGCPASWRPFHNLLHLIEHVVVESRAYATGLSHQAGMARDHVATAAPVELAHG